MSTYILPSWDDELCPSCLQKVEPRSLLDLDRIAEQQDNEYHEAIRERPTQMLDWSSKEFRDSLRAYYGMKPEK